MDITLTRMSGSGRNYLRFAETTPDPNGITASEKVGFKIIGAGINPVDALEKAKKLSWHFGPQNRQTGQYEVREGASANAETTEDEQA